MSTEVTCNICKENFDVEDFAKHFADCAGLHPEVQPMRKILARLSFDNARYDEKVPGLFIPFLFKVGELRLTAHLHIPCSKEYHKSILFALKEEMLKNG